MTILHEKTKQEFEQYTKNVPHALLLTGPIGSGKETVLQGLISAILGDHSAGRLFEIKPEEGKNTIGIETIRELKHTIKLLSNDKRVVLIVNAEKLTVEAQNSLLKILEEPPQNTIFLLSAANKDALLDTIISRVIVWQLTPPTNEQLKNHFSGYDQKQVSRALAISGGRIGLAQALLDENTSHPLLAGIESAKEVLQESKFERLCRVDGLTKDKIAVEYLLEALELITKAGLESVAASDNKQRLAEWHKKLSLVIAARNQHENSVQPKLLLDNLLINL